jgi:hypothetical protein
LCKKKNKSFYITAYFTNSMNSKVMLILGLALFVILSGCTTPVEVQVCGNGVCEPPTENQQTCSADCGVAVAGDSGTATDIGAQTNTEPTAQTSASTCDATCAQTIANYLGKPVNSPEVQKIVNASQNSIPCDEECMKKADNSQARTFNTKALDSLTIKNPGVDTLHFGSLTDNLTKSYSSYYSGCSTPAYADIDGDGNVTAIDVNSVVNAVLGDITYLSNGCTDIDGTGTVNAMDVQLAINGTLNTLPICAPFGEFCLVRNVTGRPFSHRNAYSDGTIYAEYGYTNSPTIYNNGEGSMVSGYYESTDFPAINGTAQDYLSKIISYYGLYWPSDQPIKSSIVIIQNKPVLLLVARSYGTSNVTSFVEAVWLTSKNLNKPNNYRRIVVAHVIQESGTTSNYTFDQLLAKELDPSSGLIPKYLAKFPDTLTDAGFDMSCTNTVCLNSARISNPGFESSSTSFSPWTVFGGSVGTRSIVSDQKHSGKYSLRLYNASSTSPYNVLQSASVTVKPNTSYTLKGWVKTTLTSGACQLDFYKGGVLDTPGTPLAGKTSPDATVWKEYSEIFKTPSSMTSGYVRLLQVPAIGSCWFDDISLVETNTIPPDSNQVITLYNGKSYPYNPNNTSGVYDYTVSINSSGTTLKSIQIANSRDKWNNSSSSNGPLYPTTAGQSLTGKPTKVAAFGNALATGVPGKGYAKVSFVGFDSNQATSIVEIGKVVGLPTGSIGGLKYKSADDASHTIPMAFKVAWSDTPGSFIFDGQTVWYDLNLVTGTGSDVVVGAKDLNFILKDQDFLNQLQYRVSTSGNSATFTIPSYSPFPFTKNVGDLIQGDVTYKLMRILSPNSVILAVDGSLELRRQSNTGTLIYNTNGDSTDQTYGKLYFNDNKILTGEINQTNPSRTTALLLQDSRASPGKGVYFAINPARNLGRFWFMLDAQTFGTGESILIQNNKRMDFIGTYVPLNDGIYAESIGGYNLLPYFIPKSSDFNSEARFSASNAYFVAEFSVNDILSNGQVLSQQVLTSYIDTRDGSLIGPFPNTNLAAPTSDVKYGGSPPVNLTSGNQPNYLKAAYTDNGTKFWLNDNNSVSISMPKYSLPISINVSDSIGYKSFRSPLKSGTGVELIANDLNDANTLSNLQLPSLYNKTVSIKLNNVVSTVTNSERIGIKADAKMDTSQDVKDLVTYIEGGDFFYKVKLNGNTGINLGATNFVDTGADDQIIVPFFGQEYELTEANLSTGYVQLKKI